MKKERALQLIFWLYAVISVVNALLSAYGHIWVYRYLGWDAAGKIDDPVIRSLCQGLIIVVTLVFLPGHIAALLSLAALAIALLLLSVLVYALVWLASVSLGGTIVVVLGAVIVTALLIRANWEGFTKFAVRVVFVFRGIGNIGIGRGLRSRTAVHITRIGSVLICCGMLPLLATLPKETSRWLQTLKARIVALDGPAARPTPTTATPPSKTADNSPPPPFTGSVYEFDITAPTDAYTEIIKIPKCCHFKYVTEGETAVLLNESDRLISNPQTANDHLPKKPYSAIRFRSLEQLPLTVHFQLSSYYPKDIESNPVFEALGANRMVPFKLLVRPDKWSDYITLSYDHQLQWEQAEGLPLQAVDDQGKNLGGWADRKSARKVRFIALTEQPLLITVTQSSADRRERLRKRFSIP